MTLTAPKNRFLDEYCAPSIQFARDFEKDIPLKYIKNRPVVVAGWGLGRDTYFVIEFVQSKPVCVIIGRDGVVTDIKIMHVTCIYSF